MPLVGPPGLPLPAPDPARRAGSIATGAEGPARGVLGQLSALGARLPLPSLPRGLGGAANEGGPSGSQAGSATAAAGAPPPPPGGGKGAAAQPQESSGGKVRAGGAKKEPRPPEKSGGKAPAKGPKKSEGKGLAAPPKRREPRRGPLSKHSPYRGVTCYKRTGRWEAHIWECGRQLHLGSFDTAEEAGHTYDRAVIVCRGLNSVTNFPPETYAEDDIVVLHREGKLTKEAAIEALREASRRVRGQTKRQLLKKQMEAEKAAEKTAEQARQASVAAVAAALGKSPQSAAALGAASLLQQMGTAGGQPGLAPPGGAPLGLANPLAAMHNMHSHTMQLKCRALSPGQAALDGHGDDVVDPLAHAMRGPPVAQLDTRTPSTRFHGVAFDSGDGQWHAVVPVGVQEFPAGSGNFVQYECEGAFPTELSAAQAYDSVAMRVHRGAPAPGAGQGPARPPINFPVAQPSPEPAAPPPAGGG